MQITEAQLILGRGVEQHETKCYVQEWQLSGGVGGGGGGACTFGFS